MNKLEFLSGALAMSIASILAAGTAGAQTAATAAPAATAPGAAATLDPTATELETVSVSASRLRIEGYDAPTPVTVIGTEAIQREARIDVGDLIRDLPSFGASASPNNSQNQSLVTGGVAGLNLVSLRNLGFNRNLVLFDGQRVVASSIQGGVDLSTLPASLVERIEVVTGGASAAWGSDAVAGVVNVLLNKKFDGLEVHTEASDNFSSNHAQRKVELSFGTDFAGDRGHVILSGSYTDTPDEFYSYDISGFKYQRLVSNPAYVAGNGQPRLIHATNVGLAQATPGGIITNTALAGTYFTGQNATPEHFNYGNVSQNYYTNGGTLNTSESDIGLVSAPSDGTTFFGYASFQVTDDIKASVQLNRGRFYSKANSWSDIQYGNLAINGDNPYIPAAVQQQMTALGITGFNLGTMSHIPNRPDLDQQAQDLGGVVIEQTRDLTRGVFTLDGKIGADWSWNAYYQQGESETNMRGLENQQNSRYRLAADAVRVTAANVGTSGLPLGTIACRSTLADPTNGCAPLNVFGVGNASPEAIAYVNAVARAGGNALYGDLNQKVGSISVQGPLPFGFEAGQISSAFGIEYRQEEGMQRASPAAQASTFQLGNFKNFYGKYDTKEAFVEFNVPLLKDKFVKSLAFDAAGRTTDYSTSGKVETYKLGLTNQIVDDFRIRMSYSFDIRAPQLFDLFNTGTPVTGTAIDPNTGLGVSIFNTSQGNLELKPEESTTQSIGFVLTPHWLSGLSVSLDYYDIDIKGAISSYNTSTILAQCAAGNQLFCSNLAFNGPNGALSEIFVQPLNADTLKTTGLDLAIDYRNFVGNGAINVSAVANYMFEQTITSLGKPFDYAGSIGNDSPYQGVPKFNGTVGVTYVEGPWSGTVQSRIVGSAHVNNAWGPLDIDNNDVPSMVYLDLRASYKWDNGIQVYGALDNVLDKDPPAVPFSANGASGFETPYVDAIHDAFGRVWRFGVRAKF
ncbi:MAG TPA: TonB-dependent receptor [Steroidobacteraceae bacterium]|jgi:outer membrane receptor protein involved in Fe transport